MSEDAVGRVNKSPTYEQGIRFLPVGLEGA